jgi:hypothetical protein
MLLISDNDAFCKLAASDLLEDVIKHLGFELNQCARLASLPFMINKGKIGKKFDSPTRERLVELAQKMQIIKSPSADWLDKLVAINEIDPGEALIFASAAEYQASVTSGDKRALIALRGASDFHEVLSGKIIVIEAAVLAMCSVLGVESVKTKVQPVLEEDKALGFCFKSGDPREGLRSYYSDLARRVDPLFLWSPEMETKT